MAVHGFIKRFNHAEKFGGKAGNIDIQTCVCTYVHTLQNDCNRGLLSWPSCF